MLDVKCHTHTHTLAFCCNRFYLHHRKFRQKIKPLGCYDFHGTFRVFVFFPRISLELMNMQPLNWLTPTLWVKSGNKPHPQQLAITACYDNLSITQTNFFCKCTLFIEKKTKLKTNIVPPERRWVRGQVRRSNSTHKEIVREFEKVHRRQTSC